MADRAYGLLCPISRACELIEPRWTLQILTKMMAGSTRFNEIRRGVGSISPRVLSKRLRDMEGNGLVERIEDRATASVEYIRTEKAITLEPVMEALAVWAQQNIDAEVALAGTAISPMMWRLHKAIQVDQHPNRRCVVRFHFADGDGDFDTYWLLAQRGCPTELCMYDPDLDVDLYIEASVTAFGGVVMGRTSFEREIERGSIFLSGDARLARTISRWLPPSRHAKIANIKQLP